MQTRQLLPRLLSGIALPAIPWCATPARNANLWRLKPVQRPRAPVGLTESGNPSDVFIAARLKERFCGLRSAPTKRRSRDGVYLDPIGIPPSPAEQDAFLADTNPTPMRRSIAFSRANSMAPDTRGTGSMFYDTLKSTAPWRRVRNPLLQMTTTPNE